MTSTLVFTDMDGTLLDHHTYSFDAAKPALDALEKKHIPVVPTTSKTFAEMKVLREQIGLNGPFIIENGAAVYIPHGFFKQNPRVRFGLMVTGVKHLFHRKTIGLSC